MSFQAIELGSNNLTFPMTREASRALGRFAGTLGFLSQAVTDKLRQRLDYILDCSKVAFAIPFLARTSSNGHGRPVINSTMVQLADVVHKTLRKTVTDYEFTIDPRGIKVTVPINTRVSNDRQAGEGLEKLINRRLQTKS